jgi:hypothetical protein
LTHTVDGRFTDLTAGVPATTSIRDWNASAVAIGDLDGNPGNEIVLAGGKGVNASGVIQPAGNGHNRLAILINGGTGTFTAPSNILPSSGYRGAVIADSERKLPDPDGVLQTVVYPVRSTREPGLTATALALGDLDQDGDLDIVMGSGDLTRETVFLDTSFVDYTKSPPYILSSNVVPMDVKYYGSALSVIDNDLSQSGTFKDMTTTRVPGVGRSDAPPLPAFRARDIAIGDLDGDGDLDLAITWSNPASVTPLAALTSFERYVISFGTRFHEYRFDVNATPIVATRVLLNNGQGAFTEGTDDWMPPPLTSADDYWQGHRVRLADLDGDGDLDMVILHRRGLDAYRNQQFVTYTRSSLRVLRNDRIRVGGIPANRYVDVTTAALPPFPSGSDDNFRGTALDVVDINRDGHPDIVFGSREAFTLTGGGASPSTHVFFGRGDMTFEDGRAFLPPVTTDSGEADFYLFHDFAGGVESLILMSEGAPAVSTSGQHLRVFDWIR